MHDVPAGRAAGRIVEVEAYIGEDDPACHAAPGPTKRNEPLYGPAGIAYVYLNYGVHYLANIVTESDGFPAAVLLRALEPLEGIPLMRRRRARGTRYTTVGDRPQRALPGTGQPVEGARDHAAGRTASTSRVRGDQRRGLGGCRLVSGSGSPQNRDPRGDRSRLAMLRGRQRGRVEAMQVGSNVSRPQLLQPMRSKHWRQRAS